MGKKVVKGIKKAEEEIKQIGKKEKEIEKKIKKIPARRSLLSKKKRKKESVHEKKIKEEIKHVQRKLILSKFTDRKAKFFYEFFFWIGFILIILTYVRKNEYLLIMGLISILLSLLIYEVYHKPEKKKKYYSHLLYLIIISIIGFVIYQFLGKILYILSLPVQKSWLLYVIVGLTILDFSVFLIKKAKIKKHEKKMKKKQPKEVKKPLFRKVAFRAEKKVKKSILKKIFFRKEKQQKELVKPEIRTLKVKAKKGAKPAKPKKPVEMKKFHKFLTYLFTAIILFFGLYKGIVYLASGVSDKLLFYTMLAMMFFTLLVFTAHLIVKKKIKEPKILKETKEEKLAGEAKGGEKKGEVIPKVRLDKIYKTDIDALYDLVKKRGHLKISFLAKTFNVDKKTIEDWAELLEEHELLKIHYPAIGEAELVIPKEGKKEK